MDMCLSKCYPQGPYACCCYTDGTRGSSLLQGPTNKPLATPWALSTLCRGQAGPAPRSDTTVPGQHTAGSTWAAPSAWQRQLLWLSSVGCKGPCFPNYTKQHVLFTASATSGKNTKRGIMMTHEKQNQHNFQKLFGKSSGAGSCANSMECTEINGDLPVHQEQPLSMSRLFC